MGATLLRELGRPLLMVVMEDLRLKVTHAQDHGQTLPEVLVVVAVQAMLLQELAVVTAVVVVLMAASQALVVAVDRTTTAQTRATKQAHTLDRGRL